MAMQFSKEDQEKLKNDKSEIYRKRTEETNREDVENLSKKGKWEYFKQYYLKGLIVVIVVAVLLIAGAIQAATKKAATSLYIAVQKDIINEEDVPALESAIGKYLGMDPKDEVVKIDVSPDDKQLQAYFYAGTADILIADEKTFQRWGESEYFFDSNTSKKVAFYKNYDEKYQFKTQYITGEDILNNTKTEASDTKASDKTEYNCGIYLSDSQKYRQMGGQLDKPVLGIATSTKHIEYATQFAKYMMDNNKKMDFKKSE